jgi:UDP:flavonoid glycosyltransferase YjiC (YdhE family)
LPHRRLSAASLPYDCLRRLGGSSEAAQRLHVGKVLPKPFTREELLAAVREVVELILKAQRKWSRLIEEYSA